MSTYIGIDPGVSGAIALISKGVLLDVLDMPTFTVKQGKRNARVINAHDLIDIIDDFKMAGLDSEPLIVLESVASMPRDGSVQAFAFGRSFGMIEGVIAASRVPVITVKANIWKRKMGLQGQTKDASRMLASQTWPDEAERFKRVADDGRAEAALLALYGSRIG